MRLLKVFKLPFDRPHKKLGEYCMVEQQNVFYILCNLCHAALDTDESFWMHLKANHNLQKPSTFPEFNMAHQYNTEQPLQGQHQQQQETDCTDVLLANSADKPKVDLTSFTSAENLMNQNLNDKNALVELYGTAGQDEIQNFAADISDDCLNEMFNINPLPPFPPLQSEPSLSVQSDVNINELAFEQFLDGSILKQLFLQLQREQGAQKEEHKKLVETVQELENNKSTYKKAQAQTAPVLVENTIPVEESSYSCKDGNDDDENVLPKKPFANLTLLLNYDKDLRENAELRNQLLEDLTHMHGHTPEFYIRSMWQTFMTDELCQKFCWRGVRDISGQVLKYALPNLQLYELIESAFLTNSPGAANRKLFKDRTLIFFKKNSVRVRKRLNSSDSQNKNQTATTTNVKKIKHDNNQDNWLDYTKVQATNDDNQNNAYFDAIGEKFLDALLQKEF